MDDYSDYFLSIVNHVSLIDAWSLVGYATSRTGLSSSKSCLFTNQIEILEKRGRKVCDHRFLVNADNRFRIKTAAKAKKLPLEQQQGVVFE